MSDKNADDYRNGRRSRGPSPHSEDNSEDSDSDQGKQNVIPYFFNLKVPRTDIFQFLSRQFESRRGRYYHDA